MSTAGLDTLHLVFYTFSLRGSDWIVADARPPSQLCSESIKRFLKWSASLKSSAHNKSILLNSPTF